MKKKKTMNKVRKFLFPLTLFIFLLSLAPLSQAAIIITEVANWETGDDWIEIYNTGTSGVDLSGYMITDMDGTDSAFVTATATLGAGKYAVIHFGTGTDETDAVGDANSNGYMDLYTGDTDFTGTDDQAALHDGTSYVDAVCWSNNDTIIGTEDDDIRNNLYDANWTPSPGTDNATLFNATCWTNSDWLSAAKSIGRNENSADTDTKSDWHLYTTIHTRGARNGSLVINEVLYDPSGVDTGKEWVELYNDSGSSIDLTSYDLGIYETGGTSAYYTFPSFTLNAGAYIVVHWRATGDNTATDLYTGTAAPFDDNMHNTAGYVALFNSTTHSSTTIVDYLEYGAGGQTWESDASDAGIWDTGDYIGDVTEGWTIARLPNGTAGKGYDNNQPEDWQGTNSPTPGSANNLSIIKIIIRKWRELYH